MTVKKIYVAEDGTEFTDAIDCQEYEAKLNDPLKDFRHKLTVLSGDSAQPLGPTEYNLAESYIIIVVKEELTQTERTILENFLQYEDEVPDNIRVGKGIYIWDYDCERYSFIPFTLWEILKKTLN